jgi:hypothetical protein
LQRTKKVIIINTVNLYPPASALGRRYLPHIEELCAFIARVAARYPSLSPLLGLVWNRLRRTVARLDRLAARWHNNTLHPRPHRVRTPSPPPAIPPADACRTPQTHAWLIRLHQPMAQLAPRIQLMLDDPEMLALCAAAPQAGRLLRPLCRMFGLQPPAQLRLPPRPRPPPKPKAPPRAPPPPFAEHSERNWPFVPQRLRLKVPGLKRRISPA